MAKAQIRIEENGGLEVIIPAWDDKVVYEIHYREMAGMADEVTEDGASEPDYDELAEMVCDAIREDLDVNYLEDQKNLRKAVHEAVAPGPGIIKPHQFTV